MIINYNNFFRRCIALILCCCLVASGTGVAWAQAGNNSGIRLAGNSQPELSQPELSQRELSAFSFTNNDNDGVRIFLAQADSQNNSLAGTQADTQANTQATITGAGTLDFDITAPTIVHTPSDSAGIAGEVQSIVAEISDNRSVASATLFYRTSSEDFFSSASMSADVTNSTWLATIDTTTEDTFVNYYIVAEDTDGNKVQKGSDGTPLTLALEQLFIPSSFAPIKRDNRTRWLAIGLGVLAAGFLIAASSGSGGDDDQGIVNSDQPDTCCTITFIVPNVTTE